jgi:hypothetical protein
MTTIVNNPAPAVESSGGTSLLIGIVLVIGIVALLLYFGFQASNRIGSSQINIPAPQIVVPNRIDVNMVQPK